MELHTWIERDVAPFRDKPLAWLSQQHFFRDPARATFADATRFFAPADGVLLYQKVVEPEEPLLRIKGRPYSVRAALRDAEFSARSLVIGTFMTFFDVHVNRVPYPGRLSYRQLDPIDTHNHPMLEVEQSLLDDLRLSTASATFLHHNQRMVNRIESPHLADPYFVLQIADYDVDSVTPFELKQNHPCHQGERFSAIRYGSQVDLIIPLPDDRELVPIQPTGSHVEAGVDPLVEIRPRP